MFASASKLYARSMLVAPVKIGMIGSLNRVLPWPLSIQPSNRDYVIVVAPS